jgi:hypothetical protein
MDDGSMDGDVYDARRHGLTGDGVTNGQPALAALVDSVVAAVAADGRPRVIYCPPGVYAIRDAATPRRRGAAASRSSARCPARRGSSSPTRAAAGRCRSPTSPPSSTTRARREDRVARRPAARRHAVPPAGAAAGPARRHVRRADHLPTLHGNRIWDRQVPPTQTHGLYVTERGRCVDARCRDNWGD